MSMTGGCLCGKVRYEIDAEPLTVRACWCRLCQYLGAGSGTVNAGFPADTFRVDGQFTEREDVADSGNHLFRGFCGECGTPLFSRAGERPHLIFVRVGSLDDPERVRPVMNIWAAQAPSWAVLDDRLERFDGQAPPAALATPKVS
jgi:hypothetical protein